MNRMRVIVDHELCQGHAVCMLEAPEVFRVQPSDTHYAKVEVILIHPPEELHEQVVNAARYCPNRVISIEEINSQGEMS